MDDREKFEYMSPMSHQWDAEDDDSMAEAAYLMEMDHYEQDVPTHVAELTRPVGDGAFERVTISAYAAARLIVFTYAPVRLAPNAHMVGVVREVPVGWKDMASIETFAACFGRHVDETIRHGWKR